MSKNYIKFGLISAAIMFSSQSLAQSVMAENQAAADNSVIASSVSMENSGWLVVHRSDAEGKPGPVIGHAAVDAGDSENVSVALEEEVVSGDYLMFMLHSDEGEAGVYEFSGENRADVPVMVDGKPAVTTFQVE